MKTRISKLWKVPVFCLVAGYVTFYAYVFLVSRFAVVQLPDGSYGTNESLAFLFSAMFFVLTLIAGRLLLRNMTVKERFFSAAIQVSFLLVLSSIRSGTMLSVYTTEWSRLIDRIVFAVTQNVRVAAFLSCFFPLLLVPPLKTK